MNQEKIAVSKRRVEVMPANELIKKPFFNEFEVASIKCMEVSILRNDRFLRHRILYLKVFQALNPVTYPERYELCGSAANYF